MWDLYYNLKKKAKKKEYLEIFKILDDNYEKFFEKGKICHYHDWYVEFMGEYLKLIATNENRKYINHYVNYIYHRN